MKLITTSVLITERLRELLANKVFQPLDFRRETLLDRLSIVPRFRTPRDDIFLTRLYTHQVLIHDEYGGMTPPVRTEY